MRKKLSIYSIYTIMGGAFAYYLIIQYGHDTQDIIQRIYNYNRYIIYTAASLIIGATIWPEKTLQSKMIVGLLSIVHIISLSKIVIYDQYGAQLYMFVISALSIIAVYGILWIPKALVRSVLIIPALATTIISIMLATSPFHEDIKGRDDFYNMQKIKLYIYSNEPMLVIQDAQANIAIKDLNISGASVQNIPIKQPMQSNIDLSFNTEIQFTSSIPLSNSALFVQAPNGDIYNIYSQSVSIISIGTGGLNAETTGITYTGSLGQSLGEYANKLQNKYNEAKASYIQNIVKNKIRNNIYTQYIGGKILSYLGDRFAYIATYQSNFEKRQNMRIQADLPTSKNMSGTNISMPTIPLIRSRRENFTNPR